MRTMASGEVSKQNTVAFLTLSQRFLNSVALDDLPLKLFICCFKFSCPLLY